MEDNIYNIKHISRPILPSIQKGQPAAAFFFGQLNVINHLLEHVRYNKLKKNKKHLGNQMNAFPPVPKLQETDLLFNIEKYYTKMKYKYIYILESVRHFYIKGCRGGMGQLKELGYIMTQKYNKNKL